MKRKEDKPPPITTLAYAVLIVIATLLGVRLILLEIDTRIAERNAEEISILSEVLEERWAGNGYSPSKREIAVWLCWIRANDFRERGLTFWAGFGDRESVGDPTCRPKIDSGKSRGFGSVQESRLQDYCYRVGRDLPRRQGVSLYNPIFNIEVMIYEVEFQVNRFSRTELDPDVYNPVSTFEELPLAWACIAYNSGQGDADGFRRRGINPRFTFYGDVLERVAEIEVALEKKRGR